MYQSTLGSRVLKKKKYRGDDDSEVEHKRVLVRESCHHKTHLEQEIT